MIELQDDVDTSELAGLLARIATSEHHDPLVGLIALMQGAASVCVVELKPSAFALDAFDAAAALQREKLVSLLGADRVRQ